MLAVEECIRSKYIDLNRIRSAVDNGPYEAVISTAAENVPYFSGFYNSDIRLQPERFHFVIWPRGGEPAFVVVKKRKAMLEPGQTFITDVRGYEGEGLDSMRVVAEVLQERGITKGLIGIEGRAFPGGHLLDLMQRLPNLQFADAYLFLESLRTIKTPAEIETITRAGRITAEAIDTGFLNAKIGDTERAIATRMRCELLENGMDLIGFFIFGSGDRTGRWHTLPIDKPIEDGTLIKVDLGGYLDGYISDIARTVVMGKASPAQKGVHAKLTEIKHRVVDYIRPGMTGGEVTQFGLEQYDRLGLERKWALLGHSLGMTAHEEPQLYVTTEVPIRAGMTMSVEIGYTDPPNDSYAVEDLVLIDERGARYLTDASKHEKLWEIGT